MRKAPDIEKDVPQSRLLYNETWRPHNLRAEGGGPDLCPNQNPAALLVIAR